LWIAVRHRARIFIAQSPFEGAAAAAVKVVLALFGRRVALIVESHGDFERSVFLQRRVWFAATYRRLMRLAARGALRHADLGRAVSQATRNQLRSWRGDLPIVVFPAWVDVELFTTGERPTPPSACQGILFAGAIVPRKGVHVLIDAFSQIAGRVPAAHLVIAGAEDNARYAAELRNQARALGLESRLEFVGHVPANRLVELIDRARLLALPSFSEGLPRVLLEAMLRGTPTVATRVSGTPELVRPMETGYLVDPGDASALAEALLAAFLDADIDRMGRRARDAARARVSVDDYVKGHRRLIGAACTRLGVM
jgi:glycosyltransferase involved in cell wall biosynthesis